MPRTKGRKNRPKTNTTKDYASQITEKQEAIAFLNTEVASITANMDNGGVSLGKFSDKVPADVQTKINDYADQIKSGSLLTDDDIKKIKDTLA